MAKRRMSDPIHARDLLRVELDLLMQRAAQRMQHRALHRVAQRLRIDHQSAVERADQPLHPDPPGAAVHLDLGDSRGNTLPAVRIRETAPGQDVSRSHWFRRRPRIPFISLRHRLHGRNGSRPPESRYRPSCSP